MANEEPPMETIFLLMARYRGLPIIPVETVCNDFFRPLTVKKFMEKIAAGEIRLTVVRLTNSQKAAKGVNINDLAAYLDKMHAAAERDQHKLFGTPPGAKGGPTEVGKLQ